MTESTASDGTAGERTPADGTTGNGLPRVRERAEAIRDEEVARAYSQLAARGDLTPEQRAVVAELADRIVDGVLAVPVGAIAAAEENEAVAETVCELYLE